MTFTKTSQKFGQWIDFKLNFVYGLGFSNDSELNKVKIHFFKSPINYSMTFLKVLSNLFEVCR